MEVHAHTHSPRKKWTHYLFEFFMLFLAVFCGFLAENVREHRIEHAREKKYIGSVLTDLRSDTSWMDKYMKDQQASIQAFDSVILLINKADKDSLEQKRLYYLIRMAIKLSSPNKINYSAFDQIRNSGNLRLIRNQSTVDSISNYYFTARDIEQLNETIMQRQAALVEFEGNIFDGNVFHNMEDLNRFQFKEPVGQPRLITSDKNLINNMIVRIHYLISANSLSREYSAKQKILAVHLIHYLKKEYHLK
ncbi:MAG: hypothetical protein V9F46_05140 [Chitinophagaceae bacterium]